MLRPKKSPLFLSVIVHFSGYSIVHLFNSFGPLLNKSYDEKNS